jgi:hypothetical protein
MSPADAAGGRPFGPSSYPSSWEFDELVTSGEPVLVRPIRPTDAALPVAFGADLSQGMIQRLFLDAHPGMSLDEAVHVADMGYGSRMAFVAIVSDHPVAIVGYHRDGSTVPVADIDLAVADTFQHHRVATLHLESLVAQARTKAIVRFEAEVTAEDNAALEIFEATGLGCTRAAVGGTVRFEIDPLSMREYRARCDERKATAETASIAAILRPRSIAVIGAGRCPGNAGHEVVRSLLAGDFLGTV